MLQECEFYDARDEAQLNKFVEVPGNQVMDKLRAGQEITVEDRIDLAAYIATMLKRVNRARVRGREVAPRIVSDVISDMRAMLKEFAESQHGDPAIAVARGEELSALEQKFRNEIPEAINVQIRSPWPTPQMIGLVLSMQWRILSTAGPVYFLTSDNPAFYFEGLGLGRKSSELTFPLSRQLVLWGSYVPVRGLWRFPVRQGMVKEANKRLAFGARRFVVSWRKADWIEKIALNKSPHFNSIQW